MRTTISINDKLYHALKLRAVQSNVSVSALVEDAVKYQILEDLEDIEAAEKRANEPSLSFDTFVQTLKADGLL